MLLDEIHFGPFRFSVGPDGSEAQEKAKKDVKGDKKGVNLRCQGRQEESTIF